MIKNKFYIDFTPIELNVGDALMKSEMVGLDYKHIIRTLHLEAWQSFERGEWSYDGATFVKDLPTIYNYDAPAGNHDLWYIENKTLPFFKWLVEKLKADYQYGLDMRKLQIPYTTAWSRVVALWVSTPFYPIILIFKN